MKYTHISRSFCRQTGAEGDKLAEVPVGHNYVAFVQFTAWTKFGYGCLKNALKIQKSCRDKGYDKGLFWT